jgi:hypothetical protein
MKKIHFKSKIYKKKYFKLDYNQILILDSLLDIGGKEKKFFDKNNNLRYSEHFGLLDFDQNSLSKIIISSKIMREDDDDIDILLPNDIIDIKHFEFMFHTHPPTPTPGYRARYGVLYEFPSISDIFHFAKHYNNGETQGSIVIAPEGIYILYTLEKNHKIKIPSDEIFNEMQNESYKIQQQAINKYGIDITEHLFYSVISQNVFYFNLFKKIINIHFNKKIKIKFIKRSFDKRLNKWVIHKFFLPILF